MINWRRSSVASLSYWASTFVYNIMGVRYSASRGSVCGRWDSFSFRSSLTFADSPLSRRHINGALLRHYIGMDWILSSVTLSFGQTERPYGRRTVAKGPDTRPVKTGRPDGPSWRPSWLPSWRPARRDVCQGCRQNWNFFQKKHCSAMLFRLTGRQDGSCVRA